MIDDDCRGHFLVLIFCGCEPTPKAWRDELLWRVPWDIFLWPWLCTFHSFPRQHSCSALNTARCCCIPRAQPRTRWPFPAVGIAAMSGAGAGAGAPNRFEQASKADRSDRPRQQSRQRDSRHGSGAGGAGAGSGGAVPDAVAEFIHTFHNAVKRGNVFGTSLLPCVVALACEVCVCVRAVAGWRALGFWVVGRLAAAVGGRIASLTSALPVQTSPGAMRATGTRSQSGFTKPHGGLR